jgi:hypothetical protein
MHRFRRHLSYANVMSTLALIIAVAGIPTAVAVTVQASKSSDVNKKGNIRASRVTTDKLADSNVTASKLAGIQTVQSTGGGSATANCPAGTRVLSGGGTAFPLNNSTPSGLGGQGNGWSVSGGGQVTVYALCLKG